MRRYTPDANNKCTKLLKVKTTSALDSRTKISPSNVSAPLLPGKLPPSGETGEELPLSFNKAMAEQSGSQGCFFLGFLPLVPFLFCTSFIDTSMLCWLVTQLPFHQIPDFSALRLVGWFGLLTSGFEVGARKCGVMCNSDEFEM